MAGFTYKSYNFVDKDPIIDEIRSVYEESGANYEWISKHSGVSKTTLTNWFSGTTRKPQAATVNAVLRSLGYKLSIVEFGRRPHFVTPMKQSTVPKPTTSVRHVIAIKKYQKKRAT